MPKTPVTVFDVAAYILNKYTPMAKKHGPMTVMKIQKLVYYCQAWSLAWDEGPLFEEELEAWVHGPVVRKLFTLNRGRYQIHKLEDDNGNPKGNPKKLREEQQETVDLIVEHYGPKAPVALTALTHQEPPWRKARNRGDLGPSERGSEKILHEDMKKYYSSIS